MLAYNQISIYSSRKCMPLYRKKHSMIADTNFWGKLSNEGRARSQQAFCFSSIPQQTELQYQVLWDPHLCFWNSHQRSSMCESRIYVCTGVRPQAVHSFGVCSSVAHKQMMNQPDLFDSHGIDHSTFIPAKTFQRTSCAAADWSSGSWSCWGMGQVDRQYWASTFSLYVKLLYLRTNDDLPGSFQFSWGQFFSLTPEKTFQWTSWTDRWLRVGAANVQSSQSLWTVEAAKPSFVRQLKGISQ